MSRTLLDGFVLGDVEKEYLLKLIKHLSFVYFTEVSERWGQALNFSRPVISYSKPFPHPTLSVTHFCSKHFWVKIVGGLKAGKIGGEKS